MTISVEVGEIIGRFYFSSDEGKYQLRKVVLGNLLAWINFVEINWQNSKLLTDAVLPWIINFWLTLLRIYMIDVLNQMSCVINLLS